MSEPLRIGITGLGYAEGVSNFDVDGIDAAHKLALLISLFG